MDSGRASPLHIESWGWGRGVGVGGEGAGGMTGPHRFLRGGGQAYWLLRRLCGLGWPALTCTASLTGEWYHAVPRSKVLVCGGARACQNLVHHAAC